MSRPERSLGASASQGLAWLMAQSLAARASGFLSQIVLAWLLLPSDFGKVGLALTISTLAAALVNFGVDDVLLQRQRTMRFWVRSAFWTSFGLSVACAATIAVLAPLGANAYGSPDIAPLVWILALSIPLGALATIPTVFIRASLDFRFLALYATAETLAMQIATVGLAWADFGPYSFVIPVPILAAIKLIFFWRRTTTLNATRRRPGQGRHFITKGAMVSATRVLTECVGQGAPIVLGLLTTPAIVGLYFFAFRLAAMPVRMLAGNFQNVMFSTLVRLADNPKRQAEAAFEAARLLSFVVMPLCFLQAALAEPALRLMFGTKWEDAIPLAQILSLGLPFDAISWIAGALLSARGEFRLALVFTGFFALMFFAAVSIGAFVSAPIGVACAVALYYAVVPSSMSVRAFRSCGSFASIIGRLYVVPALLSAAAIGGAYWLSLSASMSGHLVARMALICLASGLLYLVLLKLLAPDVLANIERRVRSIVGTKLVAATTTPK